MRTSLSRPFTAIACSLALIGAASGCADTADRDRDYYDRSYPPGYIVSQCEQCGRIESIQPRAAEGKASTMATIAGAIVGGVVGHQFGSGRGQDAATVGGAVAGGYAGHELSKQGSHTVYDMTIRMDRGDLRTMTVGNIDGLREGDRVQILADRVAPVG